MPIPGFDAGQRARLIINTPQYRRLATCPDNGNPPNPVPFAAVDYRGVIYVAFSGMPAAISPDLADDDGALPELLGNPAAAGDMPYVGELRLEKWAGYIGGQVNAGGCHYGQSGAVYSRLRRAPVGDYFIIEAYVLAAMPGGDCDYLLFFCGGGPGLNTILAGGAVTVDNRAYAGSDLLPGIYAAAAGRAAVSLPS